MYSSRHSSHNKVVSATLIVVWVIIWRQTPHHRVLKVAVPSRLATYAKGHLAKVLVLEKVNLGLRWASHPSACIRLAESVSRRFATCRITMQLWDYSKALPMHVA